MGVADGAAGDRVRRQFLAARSVCPAAGAIPAVLMVGVVGTIFMEVGRGPEIVRLFAVAALLWLSMLLGLGSLDPMTRIDYQVQAAYPR
jgi:hypothetical protein